MRVRLVGRDHGGLVPRNTKSRRAARSTCRRGQTMGGGQARLLQPIRNTRISDDDTKPHRKHGVTVHTETRRKHGGTVSTRKLTETAKFQWDHKVDERHDFHKTLGIYLWRYLHARKSGFKGYKITGFHRHRSPSTARWSSKQGDAVNVFQQQRVVALFRAYGSKGAGPRGSWTKEYGGSESSE
jgi:hypothetical protein